MGDEEMPERNQASAGIYHPVRWGGFYYLSWRGALPMPPIAARREFTEALNMLEINLDFIKTQALKLEDENWEFRSYLKWRSPKNLDQMAAELYREIAAQIDCCSCGNCCRQLQPALKDPDIARLAKATGLSKNEFIQEHVEGRTEEQTLWLKAVPCPFLEDNRCRHYRDRPKSCADYPFLTNKDLVFRLIGVVENLRICPIVFHVVERLKRVTGFRFKPKRNFPRS